MGNSISPCFKPNQKPLVKLIFFEGTTKTLSGNNHVAGEIMFEFPDKMVCHAESFYIGHPIPILSIDDALINGQTYFILPIDRFEFNVLSASTLASLSSSPKPGPINFGACPFQYIKDSNGRVLIKVLPEFIIRLMCKGKEENGSINPSNGFLCSTPELKKHYEVLVGSKEQVWSPKLETISEYKIRYTPCRFLGLEWKQKEKECY